MSLQNELRTANHLLTGSLAGIAAGLGGLRLAGCGINRGLRGRSDLETPEAGMMRDQSSVDAAPATSSSRRVAAWGHISPYGAFDLDMGQRLDLDILTAA